MRFISILQDTKHVLLCQFHARPFIYINIGRTPEGIKQLQSIPHNYWMRVPAQPSQAQVFIKSEPTAQQSDVLEAISWAQKSVFSKESRSQVVVSLYRNQYLNVKNK